jgi:hypothetical protein
LKNPFTKRADGVAQGEFKRQYCKKTKNKQTKKYRSLKWKIQDLLAINKIYYDC